TRRGLRPRGNCPNRNNHRRGGGLGFCYCPAFPEVLMLAALAFMFLAAPAGTPPPDLPASVYQQRRERVMKELDGCVAVLTARGETRGVTEDFRQGGDFLWLTGRSENGASILLALKAKYERSVLVLGPRGPRGQRST